MIAPVQDRTSHRVAALANPRSPVVLLAEDDLLMRRLLAVALRRDGFRVVDASDGAELEAWIRKLVVATTDDRCVDLIIADHRMPTSTGLEVLARLRHVDWSTPFILITAFGDQATHTEAKRLGAACVIDKPCDLDVLRAAALQFAIPGET